MIYKNNALVTSVNNNVLLSGAMTKRVIGKIYQGTKLVWLTIYDAIRSCFGSGKWLSDRNWINDDNWKNN